MRDQRRSLQQSDGPLPIPPPSILVVRASILLFFADLGPPCATSGGRCDRVIGPCQCRSPPPWSCVRVPASFFSGDTSCRRLADHQQGSRAVAWHKSLGTSARLMAMERLFAMGACDCLPNSNLLSFGGALILELFCRSISPYCVAKCRVAAATYSIHSLGFRKAKIYHIYRIGQNLSRSLTISASRRWSCSRPSQC